MAIKRIIFCCGLLALTLMAPSVRAAFSSGDMTAFSNEPEQVRLILERAVTLERNPDELEGEWQAAILYCQASRLGSAEGQYRLGMLYAFGKGVPASRALAASLFSVAATQGHYEAQKMLETINVTTEQLPPCVVADVLPEKAPPPVVIVDSTTQTNIDRHVGSLPENKRWMVDLVHTLAEWYSVDPKLILSIIVVESNFEIKAKSPKAAMGLMQLIPQTAERFNVKNAYDATQNIKGGMSYLRWLLSYYRGDVKLAVAAYNAGEKAVDRYKGVPPYPETRQYVKRVLELYERTTHPFDERVADPSPVLMRKG